MKRGGERDTHKTRWKKKIEESREGEKHTHTHRERERERESP